MSEPWYEFDDAMIPHLKGRPVVVTFPGPGLVSGIAGEELVESLHAKPLGPVRSVRLPPQAIVTQGRPQWPILFHDAGAAVILKCDADVAGPAAHHFAREAHAFFSRAGVSRIIVLDAVLFEVAPEDEGEPGTLSATDDADLAEAFANAGATPLEDGVVGGGTAAFLLWAAEPDARPTGALVTGAALDIPDPRAAARLLTQLDRVLSLHVNVGELSERAEELEREVERLTRAAGLQITDGQVEPAPPRDSAMYS